MAVDTFSVANTNPAKPIIVKDPDAILDYLWDWTEWLAGNFDLVGSPTVETDVITSFEVFAVGSPAPIEVGTLAQQGGLIVAFLAGGDLGQMHQVTCRVHTAGGRTDDRSIWLKIRTR